MAIYIYKNNQQMGPFEESRILEWLAVGQLSPDDLAVRSGGSQWQPLRVLYPNPGGNNFVGEPSSEVRLGGGKARKRGGSGKTFLLLALGAGGLFLIGVIAIGGLLWLAGGNRPVERTDFSDRNPETSPANSNADTVSNTATRAVNFEELKVRLKEFAALKVPAKLEKNPALKGKIVVVEQEDRAKEYTLKMLSEPETEKFGLKSEHLAVNLGELETLVQINCGKGREVGRFGPRMAYVPAYANVCNVAVIDYRASKTIAQKSFVNQKKPATIYVTENENEYLLDPPKAEIEKYLSGLPKQ